MPKFVASAPVLLVKDVMAAADYYQHKLGFDAPELFGHPTDFAMVRRDGFTVMLAQANNAADVIPHWKVLRSTWNIYFWVDDVDAEYAAMQARGATIDYTLGIKPYGVKEFGVQDLDGHDIAIGQVL